jgi:hypothetical protein
MLRLALGLALFSTVASTAAIAASQEQCDAEWTKADKDLNGYLSPNEVTRYLIALMKHPEHRVSGKAGKVTRDEFIAACKDGAFDDLIAKAQ